MRVKKIANGITVNAIAGTHIVFLGLNIDESKKSGFLGFAIQRTDHEENETYWLKGMKAFETVVKYPVPGESFSSLYHPIQGFQWADYSAKPGRKYTYRVICMYDDPKNLRQDGEVKVTIQTEKELDGTHSVFFNRGSVATQEYARRFQDKKPSEVGRGAYEWLSRGLLEALIAFIKRAKAGDKLHGAIYEFQYGTKNENQYDDVLLELKAAANRGVEVKIIYDDVEEYKSDGKPDGPWFENREAIKEAKITKLTKKRSNAKMMHNKFIVLSNANKNIAVWTGSTNLTENGIFGHSNLGHIVEDEVVADAYLDYWKRLYADPEIDNDYRTANMEASPVPENLNNGTTPIFSPRSTKLDSLNWYAELASTAKKGLFMTFAFGMHELFREIYNQNDGILRMALMEKAAVKKDGEALINELRKQPNTIVAIGNRIPTNSFDRWLKEIDRVIPKLNVYWIHTKYMLVDPLGNTPVVISGSANFSKNSTDTNDENMLVIKGDKRIADIYFCEYMRLYTHYAFRESVKRALENKKIGKAEEWAPQWLATNDDWLKDYFTTGIDKAAKKLRRLYFSASNS